MAIIPDGMQFIGISPDIVLQEKKSAQVNGKSEPYRMTDIIETVSAEILTGADWGDIEGTLSEQTDLQSALDAKQDDLVSGTNIKTINGESLLGSTDIETASVNPSSTFLPINTSGSFTDSPIFATKALGDEGFNNLETKVNGLSELPGGGIEASPSWGIRAELNLDTNIQRVQLGDFDNYTFTGKFEWSTGGIAPFNASYIKFDTYGYDLFECTYNYFKLDAKTGNPSRVDGLLFDINAGGFGYGRGLENGIGSYEESIYWNLITGDFNIKGIYGSNVLFSNPALAQTYIMDGPSKLGIEMSAMYISDDLAVTTAVSGTYTKVLNVRDESGNSYAIKLHSY